MIVRIYNVQNKIRYCIEVANEKEALDVQNEFARPKDKCYIYHKAVFPPPRSKRYEVKPLVLTKQYKAANGRILSNQEVNRLGLARHETQTLQACNF